MRIGIRAVVVIVTAILPGVVFAEAKGLGIENFSHSSPKTKNLSAGYTYVSFDVVNVSDKAIFGYSLVLVYTLPNGKTVTELRAQDFTITSPKPNPPGVSGFGVKPTGPLEPRQRQDGQVFLHNNDPVPVSVEPVVVAVVFEDNSVSGDVQQAIKDFFKPHEVICAEYKWYIGALQKAQFSPDGGREGLDGLRQGFGWASSETKYPRLFSKFQSLSLDELRAVPLSFVYARILRELEAANRQLDDLRVPPILVVAQCIKSAEAQLSFYSDHLQPRY